MLKKVVLLIPNSGWSGMRYWATTPYSILILTSLLKKIVDLSLVDANGRNLSEQECADILRKSSPDAVLLSAMSFEYAAQYRDTLSIVKTACPGTITVVGGVHATLMPESVMKDSQVDYVFIGHAEERIADFLSAVLNGDIHSIRKMPGIGYRTAAGDVVIAPVETHIADVKEMVKPDYSLIDMEPYLAPGVNAGSHHLTGKVRTATILTSYGCPYHCIFCANAVLSRRRVAFRPVSDVLEEIDFLVNTYRVGQIVFIDDCFLYKRERLITLFNAFLDRGYQFSWKTASVPAWLLDKDLLLLMEKSGCTQISISVESGVPRVLHDIIRKPLQLEIISGVVRMCREVGIDIGANFVIGFPGETWEEIRQTFRYAEACDFDVIHFHVATPFPNTDLYHIAKAKNLLPDGFSFENIKFFGHSQGYITTNEFTPEELMTLRAYEWDRINFSSKEKIQKVATMYGMTLDELEIHRKKTRRGLGVMGKG